MTYENILYEVSDRIARITLNRPRKLNTLSRALLIEYGDALGEAERDGAVRVVILRAAGRAFCAGYDVGGGGRYARVHSQTPFIDDRAGLEFNDAILTKAWNIPRPVIA